MTTLLSVTSTLPSAGFSSAASSYRTASKSTGRSSVRTDTFLYVGGPAGGSDYALTPRFQFQLTG